MTKCCFVAHYMRVIFSCAHHKNVSLLCVLHAEVLFFVSASELVRSIFQFKPASSSWQHIPNRVHNAVGIGLTLWSLVQPSLSDEMSDKFWDISQLQSCGNWISLSSNTPHLSQGGSPCGWGRVWLLAHGLHHCWPCGLNPRVLGLGKSKDSC